MARKGVEKKKLTREEARPLAAIMEKKFKVALPERLRTFFDSGEYIDHHGSYVWDLPFFSGDSKMKLAFASKSLPHYFEYASDVFGVTPETHLPIASAGSDGTYFVAVDTTQPSLPVSFFDYESGFHKHAETFDEFLSRLLKKGEKTPVEKIEKAHDDAKELWEADKYAECAAILEPALASFVGRKTPVLIDEGKELVGGAINLLALCRDKLGNLPLALELWKKAYEEYDVKSAALNVCNHLLNNTKEYEELVTYGEQVDKGIWRWIDEYAWYWVRIYLGYAYVVTGREEKAVLAYHEILDYLGTTEPEKVARAVKDLKEEIVGGNIPHADIAKRILEWLDVPPRTPSAEEIAKNRAWWATVPPKVKEKLKEEVKVEKGEPDDDALARILRLSKLDLDNCEISDLKWLSAFNRIYDLDLEDNAIKDLSPLSTLTALRDLDLGNNKITSLQPIAGLTRITDLDLSENGLTSIAGLENMHDLEKLRINENKLTSVEPLAGLRSLQELTAYNNDLRDITPLASCKRLKEISQFGNDNLKKGLAACAELPFLEDIEGDMFPRAEKLAFSAKKPGIIEDDWGYDDDDRPPELPKASAERIAECRAWWAALKNAPAKFRKKANDLVKDAAERLDEDDDGKAPANPSDECLVRALKEDSLHFDECELTSLDLVAPFVNADWISVDGNPCSDLRPLAKLVRARRLNVGSMPIDSLEPLRALVHLEDLLCTDTRITSLAGIETMTGLRELTAQNNPLLRDISALAGLLELREVFFEKNALIDTIAPLAKMKHLRRLWIYGTTVTDLSPLAGCTNLEELICFSLPGLHGAAALQGLPFLRQVTSHKSLPAAEVEAFRKARPDVAID